MRRPGKAVDERAGALASAVALSDQHAQGGADAPQVGEPALDRSELACREVYGYVAA